MQKTFNPFKIIGSWLGLCVGYLFFLKGVDVFGFIFSYTGIPVTNLLARNMTAGFMLGFAIHIFVRAGINAITFRGRGVEKMKEYKAK